jgi:hypothetical protein
MGWVVNATPRPLYPRVRPGTYCIGGWVGPQGLTGRVRKISPPTGIRSPDRPALIESLYRLRYPGLEFGTFLTPVTTVRQSVATLGGLVASGGWGRAKADKVSGRNSMPIEILTNIREMPYGNQLCQQFLLPTCVHVVVPLHCCE